MSESLSKACWSFLILITVSTSAPSAKAEVNAAGEIKFKPSVAGENGPSTQEVRQVGLGRLFGHHHRRGCTCPSGRCACPPHEPPHIHRDFSFTKRGRIVGGGDCVKQAGDVIDYTIVVTNTGHHSLTLESVADSSIPLKSPVPFPHPLAPGRSIVFRGQYTVTAADMKNGFINNTATARTREAGTKNDAVSIRICNGGGQGKCPKCDCVDCCKMVQEEEVYKWRRPVKLWKTVNIPVEKTVPYCYTKCENGKCIEVIGTRTIREFKETKVEVDTYEEIAKFRKLPPTHKCMKCGFIVRDCPDPFPGGHRHDD